MRSTSKLCARMQWARIPWARAIYASLASLVCLAGNVQGQCDEASTGFYLPSLQTLVMMPLSQAGDRLEAHWASHWYSTKQTNIGVSRVQCDVLGEPLRRAQPSEVRPSYVLEDRSVPANRLSGKLISSDPLSASGVLDAGRRAVLADDKDEQMAKDLNEPVRFKRPDSKAEAFTVLASKPVSNSRAGEIKDRHQQRKRAENFGQKL